MVYVINKNGNPLMPCKAAKARKLLRRGKAKVLRRIPFVIVLLWDCEEKVQEVIGGIDSGSKVIGSGAVGNGKVFYQSETFLRGEEIRAWFKNPVNKVTIKIGKNGSFFHDSDGAPRRVHPGIINLRENKTVVHPGQRARHVDWICSLSKKI